MSKVFIEFINTCPCCEEYGRIVEEAAKKYGDVVETKIYYAGKDFDYVKKYGMISKGTLIINENKKVSNLSKSVIEQVIEEAVTNR